MGTEGIALIFLSIKRKAGVEERGIDICITHLTALLCPLYPTF
jgi:hypothetical protein